uniref:Uncharacterized protein n=1 Tax=Mola mola TaxID=94237 RepID=A0A3Q3W0F9_MOLML
MAETLRSLADHREPHSLDSDGEGVRPPPPLRRGCGRKRKGTPVKVFVSHTEEECVPEHSFSSEDEPLALTAQRQHQQEYVTPSWSLSPSSSPISHSDPSDSDAGDEDSASPRGRTPRRRKKRRGTPSKKKTSNRIPSGRPPPVSSSSIPTHSRPLHSPHSPVQSSPHCSSSSSSSSIKPVFKAPAPLSSNATSSVNINVPRGAVSIDSMRQTCEYCGRHFRSLGRHLDKHHAHQPEVCSSLVERYTQMPRLHAQNINSTMAHTHTQQHSKLSQVAGQSASGRHHLLPLLSSLSSLVLYLRRLQHSAFLSLSQQLQSAEAWRLLCHSSLALLILYNRRRECEVSKLSITEYRARVTPQCPVPVPPGAPPALTPLEASLSPFERLVLPHLPRVGVQGKRGRVQPLILPPHCEPCLELLLQTRQDVGVDPANPYVFARPYHSPATPLRGTDLLRSLAHSSGTRNPRALTQTRVRRQVAILTQLLLLGEGEEPGQSGSSAVERLEQFLEREYHVTQNCAGIGQDPGLMGRVGRVVLCGERDGVLFRGMSLNHICLELDMSGNSADSYSEGESEGEHVKEKPEVPGKRGVLKRPWSEAERAAVEEHLTRNITELRVPAKADCERCLQQCPLLVSNHRDWRAIKFYCHNRIQLLKKNQRRESEPQPLTVC